MGPGGCQDMGASGRKESAFHCVPRFYRQMQGSVRPSQWNVSAKAPVATPPILAPSPRLRSGAGSARSPWRLSRFKGMKPSADCDTTVRWSVQISKPRLLVSPSVIYIPLVLVWRLFMLVLCCMFGSEDCQLRGGVVWTV